MLSLCLNSSRSSSWCEGCRCICLSGVRILASATKTQRNHPKVHSLLLQPLPHGMQQIH